MTSPQTTHHNIYASRYTKMCFSGGKNIYSFIFWLVSGSSFILLYMGNGYGYVNVFEIPVAVPNNITGINHPDIFVISSNKAHGFTNSNHSNVILHVGPTTSQVTSPTKETVSARVDQSVPSKIALIILTTTVVTLKRQDIPPLIDKSPKKEDKNPELTSKDNVRKQNPFLKNKTPQKYINSTVINETQKEQQNKEKHLNESALTKNPREQLNPSFVPTSANLFSPTIMASSETNDQRSRVAYLMSHGPKNWTVDCNRQWVTSHLGGRFGNQMCEYAHLLVLHIEHGIQVGLLPAMNNALRRTFPNLSLELLPFKCLQIKKMKTYSWATIDSMLAKGTLISSAASGGFPCNASRLWKYRDIWRKEFAFSSSLSKTAKVNILKSLGVWRSHTGSNQSFPLQVGVHVRRSDYIPYLMRTTGANVLKEDYFIKAFKYFRKRYGNVAFLLSSDDRRWCQQMLERSNIKDVVVTPYASATEDLALLSMSDHLIMSLGTYSFWAATLSKGIVTFPKYVGEKSKYFMTENMKIVNSSDLIPLS